MESISLIVGIAAGIIGLVGGYTVLIFKIGQLTSRLNQNTALIIEVREIVVNDKKRIEGLEERILVLETEHKMRCEVKHE